MSLNPFWEDEIYAQGMHQNRYPYDSVVTFIFRNFRRDVKRNDIRILEVGCGCGNNLWFAAREGFKIFGVDGSPSAIEYANRRLEEDGLAGDLRVSDFASLPFESEYFDFVIDRCSIVFYNLCPLFCSYSGNKRRVPGTQDGWKVFF